MAKQSRKLNKTTLAIIKESLQIGAPLNRIAPCVGMTPALLNKYIRSEEYDADPWVRRLREVYHEANLEFALTMLKVIRKCAAGGGVVESQIIWNDGRVTVFYIRELAPDARAAQWLLERLFPEYSARRVDDAADSYDPNEVVVLAIAGGPEGRKIGEPPDCP